MEKITRFIWRNTRSESFVAALLKALLIAFPLGIGLVGENYLSETFCKSLLLYLAPLLFDTGMFLHSAENSVQHEKVKDEGIILMIAMFVLLLATVALTLVSLIGIFENEWLNNPDAWISFIHDLEVWVYGLMFLEAAWYFIETFALAIRFVIRKAHVNTQAVIQSVSVSADSDSSRNL